jgi:Tfp pilus assembly protein PilF
MKIDPELKIAQTNLAIALFNAQEIDAARVQAEGALKADPNRLQLHYLLGLIAKKSESL